MSQSKSQNTLQEHISNGNGGNSNSSAIQQPPRTLGLVSADDYAYDDYSSDEEPVSLVSDADHHRDQFFDINQITVKGHDAVAAEPGKAACA